jgi:hypothetical protein
MSAWESIFLQSPVNGGCYEEDELAQQNWDWPNRLLKNPEFENFL